MPNLENFQLETTLFKYHQFLYFLNEKDYPQWNGIVLQKNPLDLWIYLELIQKIKPDVIIECGTGLGTSASFFSMVQRFVNPNGIVITIDEKQNWKKFITKLNTENIKFITGTSQHSNVVTEVSKLIKKEDIVFVSLDAGHTKDEVYKELKLYSSFVTPGSYIVVEDSNIGITITTGYEGPKKAISKFLKENSNFSIDSICERFGVTYNPGGWLKKE